MRQWRKATEIEVGLKMCVDVCVLGGGGGLGGWGLEVRASEMVCVMHWMRL